MDNQDKLFEQIKKAAENAETKDFPGMEKVWSRVDAKLDTKAHHNQNKLWRKIAVAASILLVISIGYQFFREDKVPVIPQNNVVITDSIKSILPKTFSDSNAVATSNPIIKNDADKILKNQIATQNTVASAEVSSVPAESQKDVNEPNPIVSNGAYNSASANNSGAWLVNRNFESVGVQYKQEDKVSDYTIQQEAPKVAKKQKPILIVDDELSKKELSNLNEDELESIIELPDPLYIINGVNYKEEELFGANPTSPYAPLNKQKIETIAVLQPEKATELYGPKGAKGVVIITTKDGKPTPK